MSVSIERFRTTLELFEAGVVLQRQTLRRRFPDKSEREIDQLLNQWLSERPGAEHGDRRPVPDTSPPRLLSTLRLIATSLSDLDRRFALVGSLAVSFRAEPRFTRDRP